jgi:single-strand DNA-binding protein
MFNRIILVGRLTADPEMRYTPNSIAVVKFTLAVNRNFNSKQGEKETDFIDIVAWRGLAETCTNYLKKGYMVAAEGRLQIRSYEDSQGVRRKVSEVIADNVRFLDRGKDSNKPINQSQNIDRNDDFEEKPFTEDDLPF